MFLTRNLLIILILLLLIYIFFHYNSEHFSYVKLTGDCSGNNISSYTNTNLDQCKQICNDNPNCKGFSISNNLCIPKSNACNNPVATNKELIPNVWQFFKKITIQPKYKWTQIQGRLSYVAISPDGNHIWGCNSGGDIF